MSESERKLLDLVDAQVRVVIELSMADGSVLLLSKDDALKLYDELDKVFGWPQPDFDDEPAKEIVPVVVPVYQQWPYTLTPYNPTLYGTVTITCGISASTTR